MEPVDDRDDLGAKAGGDEDRLVDVAMAHEGAQHLRPLVLGHRRALQEVEGGVLVVDADRDQRHRASAGRHCDPRIGLGARDAERVQQSPAQRSGAVVEVVHQDLQLDGEVHVVHGGAEGHGDDLGREVEDRVDVRLDQAIGDILGGARRACR